MALLDMCFKHNLDIEVAHVNYHKRDSAKRDEKIVREYCKSHNIKFNLRNYKEDKDTGNFQAKARVFRYEFFNDVCKKHNLDVVLVAHHKDDLIETYLMQVNKKLGVDTYGLAKSNNLYGVNVYRPLLKYTKKQLIKYCETNNIKYGIDESNLENHYQRNIYRHNYVDKLTLKEKNEIVKEINNKNKEKQLHLKQAKSYLKKDKYTPDEFVNIPYIDLYLKSIFTNKSINNIHEILRQLKESKSCVFIDNGWILVKEYDYVMLFVKPFSYSYEFNNMKSLKNFTCEEFKISNKGKSVNGVCLKDADFPITIRNFKDNDSIKMKFGTKKINRFFIDKKLSLKDRLSWPIMFDNKGNAILVPSLGCDVQHYDTYNFFMIKLK